jgi:flagellar basal-body rod protein FlgB
MADLLFSDDGFRAAKIALDGLAKRQEVISKNMANVDTPGYHAETLNFEDALKSALEKSSTLSLNRTQVGHMSSTTTPKLGFQISEREGGVERADQNNVDMDKEFIDMSETGIRYLSVAQTLSKKFVLLKTILK